ncbi:MAG TPA: SMP-30/gluconolactonase/LRE family protein [Thermoanaerobaculia bacterium]|jgi:sugar lactone lactonase YvrE|nr:SMP-30/gluconolactonase/LRE family protein [Thermoanaerobaculia bacterium]
MVRPGPKLLFAFLLGSACARTENAGTAGPTAGSKERPSGKTTVAFTLREKDLIPEGIAADPATGRLFVGSIEKRKIVALSPEGKESSFVPSGAAGLGPVIGLRVDSARGWLWAVSEPAGRPKSDPGTFHGLYAFTLADGSLAARVELPRALGSGHELNDLCVDDAGTVYVTDSEKGTIFRAEPGAKKLVELILTPPSNRLLRFANGIACTPDGTRLYVATADGVAAVDPKRGTAILLATPPEPQHGLGGLDGLYLEAPDRLVGIQNGINTPRVLRATLDASGLAAARIEILEAGHPSFEIPTTGAILHGALFFIANSQVDSYDAVGNLDRRKLKRPVILRLPL